MFSAFTLMVAYLLDEGERGMGKREKGEREKFNPLPFLLTVDY
ncbi:hypothetical protein WDZ92_13150 [Nostoc sp. NIES-2111]